MTRYGIGVDPDLHSTAIAVVSFDGPAIGVVHAATMVVPSRFREREAAVQSATRMAQFVDTALMNTPPLGAYSIAVEAQHVHGRATKVDPADLINLALVSGAALSCLRGLGKLTCPNPSTWDGGFGKDTVQGRAYRKLGWPCRLHRTKSGAWCIPQPPGNRWADFGVTEWKHVGDAIALAIWAGERV